MTANRVAPRVRRFAPSRVPAKVSWWDHLALAAILALSAFLNLFRLTSEGYGNVYYAATVKNMLTSWQNFFFATFDAGFVTVDKPPLGFWIQASSAWLFGFQGWALLLPQAIAGILSVAVLYHLVRRSFGPVAGLLAALVMAVTPISVVTSRHNNLESLLVLAVLLAAWAFVFAAETGRLRWLLVGALMVGLGFNIKMLAAFMVLPAFYLLYLVAAPVGWWRRMVHLGLATVVLLVVSLSWTVAVELTPADQRPYIGTSSDNTVTDLIAGNNGARPLTRSDENAGDIVPLKLLNKDLAGQIGWLLPLTVVGMAAASWQRRPRLPLGRRHQALVLWGMWFLTQVALFSVISDFDPYYLAMLAPAVAALVGAGVVALWNDYQSLDRGGWLLPLTLGGTASLQVYILASYPDWGHYLTPIIVTLSLAATIGIVAARVSPGLKASKYPLAAISVGVLALLVAPLVWSASTILYGAETRSPRAGPRVNDTAAYSRSPMDQLDPVMLNFLQANRGDAKYLVAATNSSSASPIILGTGDPVISLGGFTGRDPVLETNTLANLVDEGAVRFFLMQNSKNNSMTWVQENCEQIPQELWQSSNPKQMEGSRKEPLRFYDCSTGSP